MTDSKPASETTVVSIEPTTKMMVAGVRVLLEEIDIEKWWPDDSELAAMVRAVWGAMLAAESS